MTVRSDAFTGLAKKYREARPTYPPEAARLVAGHARDALGTPGALMVDVGAGTGIATLSLLGALPETCRAIGVEPNDDMRAEAAAAAAAAAAGRDVSFVAGSAEDIPVAAAAASLVVVGQAIHWFDRPAFYAEAARVLVPGGVVAVLENNRDWRRSPLLDDHESYLEAQSAVGGEATYSRLYRDHPYAQELFRAFGNVHAESFAWDRPMTVEAFLTMVESSTQAQRVLRRVGHADGLSAMRAYCERHAGPDGLLSVAYATDVYLARKAG